MMSSSVVGSEASPLSPLLSLREGDLLAERYRIESLVQARSAIVHFAATDVTRGTRVSAHVLVAPASRDPRRSGSLERDQDSAGVALLAGARRAKALASPHVARVLDAGVTADGHPWIVREHLESAPLAAHLRQQGALGTHEAVDVALAVCDAVAEAHAHDILHLSVGPHAVHVAWSASGLVDIKVIGTGTARAEATLALGSTDDVEPFLRAPEQLRNGSNVDRRADVWGIAVLLHTMLAGAPPFSADTPSAASLAVVVDDAPSLAGVPDELADIVERALAKDPEQRPQTVLELAESLVAFSSRPDVERDRIARRRRPLDPVLPIESDPTLVIDKRAYDALALEQTVAKLHPPAPPSSVDVLVDVDVTPSARELPVAPPSRPALPTLAPLVQALESRDLPTRITRKPDRSFPRRQVFKVLGLVTAAACVALLVLIGTEGALLSRGTTSAAESVPVVAVAPTAPTADAPPVAAMDLPAAPADTATASSPAALPEAPRASARPDAPRHPRPFASAAGPSVTSSHSSVTTPASKPSQSGSADDLRRFLDDRR